MEFLPDSLSRHILPERPIPYRRALEIAIQVCRGLSHAHNNGVVHRDIKPPNILLTEDGTVKITDFRLVREVGSSGGVVQTQAIASWQYAPPEQQLSNRPIDYRADIYSLGVTLFEMLTGSLPFRGESRPVEIEHRESPVPPIPEHLGVPGDVEAIVHRAMEKRPEDRFANADAMATALTNALTASSGRDPRPAQRSSSVTQPTRPPTPPKTPVVNSAARSASSRTSNANPWLLFGGLTVVVVIALLGAAVLMTRPSGPSPESLFPQLAVEFQNWRNRWVALYGEPPYIMEGVFSGSIPIQIPMCGLVTAHGGFGFKGFETNDSVKLGNQKIVLAGRHKLDGSIWTSRGYTVEVRPPTLLEIQLVTKKYNDQLRKFLDLCIQ